MKPGWLTLTACFSVWLVAGSVEAQWARCASDMDQLRVASEQAHEAFARLASLQVDVENRDADFRRCQQDLHQYRIDIQCGATISALSRSTGAAGRSCPIRRPSGITRRHSVGSNRPSTLYSLPRRWWNRAADSRSRELDDATNQKLAAHSARRFSAIGPGFHWRRFV